MPSVVRLLLVVAAFAGAGCRAVGEEQDAACDDTPTAASVAPLVDGFRMAVNRSVDPVECGMGYSRALVYEPVDPTTPDLPAVPRAYPSPIGTGPQILAGLSEGLP